MLTKPFNIRAWAAVWWLLLTLACSAGAAPVDEAVKSQARRVFGGHLPTREQVVARARSALGQGIQYSYGSGGLDPLRPGPGVPIGSQGEFCDARALVAWSLGIVASNAVDELDMTFLIHDAQGDHLYFEPVKRAQPGDVALIPEAPGSLDGVAAMGLVTAVDDQGNALRMVTCAPSTHVGERPLPRGAIYVRYKLIDCPVQPHLPVRQWEAFNHRQLSALLRNRGRSSPTYDPRHPPYAVFDWDNTSIFLDIEEAVFVYQLQNLCYAMTPAEFAQALRHQVPESPFKDSHLSIDPLASDILASYAWLYSNYDGLKGKRSLAEVQRDPHYSDFITKMRYLYEELENNFPPDVAYPWLIYQFAGMNENQVRQVTRAAIEWQLRQPIETVQWTSPASLAGRSGVVSVKWKNGLRLLPEMQDLYQALRDAGFDVWVCSASFVDVVREISSNPRFGYNNPASHVIALELERDARGSIKALYRSGHELTYGPGKTLAIRRLLVSKYGYGPTLVGGDSEGDQNMMQDFADTQLVLIVNLLRRAQSDIGKLSRRAVENHGQDKPGFLLQGRDDRQGTFVDSQRAFRTSNPEGQLLAP